MSKKISSADMSKNKKIFIDKFFLSYADEEEWLNKMAESGLYLVKKVFYRYYFKKESGLDIKYSVELLEHPADNPLSESYIEQKRKSGVELAAHYKCKAYFQMNSQTYKNESEVAKKTRVKSVSYMFAAFLIGFIASVVMFCYHCVSSLNFTISGSTETMGAVSEEFGFFRIFENLSSIIKFDSLLGNYQSTPLALMFLICSVVLSVPVAVYFRELFLCKRIRNSKIKK